MVPKGSGTGPFRSTIQAWLCLSAWPGGVTQDMHEAVNWYREAAEQGNVAVQYNLAVVYCDGEGIDQDYTESFKWLRKAAEAGNPSAQYHLGYSYYSGIFTARDVGRGLVWFRKAAEQGYTRAQDTLRDLGITAA